MFKYLSEVRAVRCLNEQVFCSGQSVLAGLCVQHVVFLAPVVAPRALHFRVPWYPLVSGCSWGFLAGVLWAASQLLWTYLAPVYGLDSFPSWACSSCWGDKKLSSSFLQKFYLMLWAAVRTRKAFPLCCSHILQAKHKLQHANSKLNKWQLYLVTQVFPERSWAEEFSVRQLFSSSVLSLNYYSDSWKCFLK